MKTNCYDAYFVTGGTGTGGYHIITSSMRTK